MVIFKFIEKNFQDLHAVGRFLCLAIILLPTLRICLYSVNASDIQGLFFTLLVSIFELIFILLFIIDRKEKSYRIIPLNFMVKITFFIWLICALWAIPKMVNQPLGIGVTCFFILHFLFFLTLCSYLKSQPFAKVSLLYSVIIGAVLFLPAFWIGIFLTYQEAGFTWVSTLPGSGNVRHMGYYLGAIVTLLALFPLIKEITESKFRTRLFLFLLLVIFWIMLLWSGGRGSAIAVLGTISACLIFFRPKSWVQFVKYNLAAIIISVVVSIFLPLPAHSYGIFRFFDDAVDFNDFSSGRLEIWQKTYSIWTKNFWFGVGAGQWKELLATSQIIAGQPHNIFLQALTAWGIIGGGTFLFLLIKLLGKQALDFIKAAGQEASVKIPAFGLSLALSVNALVDGTLYYPFPFFLFILGLSIAYDDQKD